MLNIVCLMGRMTAEPELKYTPANIPVTSFTLAVDRSYVKPGEERQTDFINIVAWRNTAEFVCRYFRKGQLVAVNGSIQTRKYTDKDGNNRTAFEIVAANVHFAESKKDSARPAPNANGVPPAQYKPDVQPDEPQYEQAGFGDYNDFDEIDNGDLPF